MTKFLLSLALLGSSLCYSMAPWQQVNEESATDYDKQCIVYEEAGLTLSFDQEGQTVYTPIVEPKEEAHV